MVPPNHSVKLTSLEANYLDLERYSFPRCLCGISTVALFVRVVSS